MKYKITDRKIVETTLESFPDSRDSYQMLCFYCAIRRLQENGVSVPHKYFDFLKKTFVMSSFETWRRTAQLTFKKRPDLKPSRVIENMRREREKVCRLEYGQNSIDKKG